MKRKVFKKTMAVILAAGLAAGTMTGCGGTENETVSDDAVKKETTTDAGKENKEESTEAGDVLTICYPEDLGTFSPGNYDTPMFAQDWVYEGLTRWEDNKVKPGLAESWDISEDGKVYTFHLRQGVTFTDGSEFNAEVVKKNMDSVLSHREDHSWLEVLNELQSVEVVDNYTVAYNLENSYYPALQELTLPRPVRFCAEAAFPESGDTYTDGVTEAIGTGPWKMTEHEVGQYVVFERNEDYWGEKPEFKTVRVEVIPDANTAVNALKAGEIDMIYDITGFLTADAFTELQDSGFYTKVSEPISNLDLAVNSNRGATKDVKVRQALEYGIDKKLICENVFYNLRPEADFIFDTTLPYCDVDVTTYAYDVDKANQLLDEAGWNLEDGARVRTKEGEKLSVEYVYVSTDNVSKNLGQVLQSMYEAIGVEIVLTGLESDAFNQAQKDGSFGLIVSETWGSQFDPHSMVSSYREPSHADYAAQSGLENKKELDELVTNVMIEPDETKRREMYTEIFGTLMDNAIYIPVCSTTNLCAAQEGIEVSNVDGYNQILLTGAKRVK